MINKVEVGKRIGSMRKEIGLSQSDFADKLGVTAQAVSKWETGLALPDIEILLSISWLFKLSVNEILEGDSLFEKIANRPFAMNDIACFVPDEELDDDSEFAKQLAEEKWIKRNWEYAKESFQRSRFIGQKISGHGGLILEIGTRPAGGYMPVTLLEDFDANLIISGQSSAVVREWKRFFDKEYTPPNVHYAVLKNSDLPFKDSCIDVVSSGGGLTNARGDKFKGLQEIYRVLKLGGLFVSGEGFVTQEMLKSLPEDVQKILLEKRPDIFEDYYEATITAGFRSIDTVMLGSWSTKGDKSTIADLANELGVELIFTSYLRYCIK